MSEKEKGSRGKGDRAGSLNGMRHQGMMEPAFNSQSLSPSIPQSLNPSALQSLSPAIVAQGLVKRYQNGRITALDGLDLEVREGEFVALCGPSGCGKSTLLNFVAAIDRPDAGTLHVLGHSVTAMPEPEANRFRATQIGLIFQLHNLLPHLTAVENVQVPMMMNGLSPGEMRDRAGDLLVRVGLEARMDSHPPTLSGGERQRVAIARAVANKPRLLLADEPTGALDSKTGGQVFDLLDELRAERGMTLVVVTHDRDFAARAERVVQLLDGRVVE